MSTGSSESFSVDLGVAPVLGRPSLADRLFGVGSGMCEIDPIHWECRYPYPNNHSSLTMKPHLKRRECKCGKQVMDKLFVEHVPCLGNALFAHTTAVYRKYTQIGKYTTYQALR